MSSSITQNEINQLTSENIPVRAELLAKRYYEPTMQGLIDEGGTMMGDWVSSFIDNLAAQPTAGNTISPEMALQNSMREGGRKFGLYQANANARDFWNTNSNNLANNIVKYYGTKLDALQNRYKMEREREESDRQYNLQASSYGGGSAGGSSLSKIMEMLGVSNPTPDARTMQLTGKTVPMSGSMKGFSKVDNTVYGDGTRKIAGKSGSLNRDALSKYLKR